MTTAAIICEYNPFHNGHQKQFTLTQELLGSDATIVCLMSGNFVQRGEPAVFDKMTRARAAVQAGADLVLELPVTCALRSAEGFGGGAVDILNALGCIDFLSFGCESGDSTALQTVAGILLSDDYPPLLQAHLAQGLSFAAARERAVQELTGLGGLLREPNNILAVEYCKALLATGSSIQPLAIARSGDYHTSSDPINPSASTIRTKLLAGERWDDLVPSAYEGAVPHAICYGERAMLARLRALTAEQWQTVPYGTEGLWSKVMKASRSQTGIDGIITASISKRYPRTRLQRLLMCAYLGISAETLASPAPYVRVLAFTDRGRAILRQAKNSGSAVLINAGEDGPDPHYAELERRTSDLYGLFSAGPAECAAEQNLRVYYKGN